MSTYTIIKNNVVDNVIEADTDYIAANHDDDIAILGSYPIGYVFKDGVFTSPVLELPVDVSTIADTTGYTGLMIEKPILPLTDIVISNPAILNGNIYWLKKDTAATVTGNVGLPDGNYMLIAEKVINGKTVVDDNRLIANVTGGVLTIDINFANEGNYLISAKRLNEGFDRIDAPVHLSFDDIEFDIHVNDNPDLL